MSKQITLVYGLDIMPGKVDGFRNLSKKAAGATRVEPGTLIYEYAIGEDGHKAYIIERHRQAALVSHAYVTFAPFAGPILEHIPFAKLTVYGDAGVDIRKRLDPFNATYLKTHTG